MVTTVELSVRTVLPAASWIVAVRVRPPPEARSAVEPDRAILAAPPATTLKVIGLPLPGARLPEVALIVTEPARTPVTDRVATPLAAVAVPRPLTVPAPVATS